MTQTQPRLRRGLKVLGTLLITLSAITPASSVFIIAPGVVGQAGTGAVWSFLAAGVVGVFMAFVYAELASAYPVAGGEYTIVGRTMGRLPGFMMMGLMLVIQLFIVAVIALGVGIYLSTVFDGLNGSVVAAVTVVLAAVFGIFDIRLNAVVTGIFLAIEIIALCVLAALGFLNVERSLFDTPVVGNPSVTASVGLIGAATAIAIFAYNGYGSAVSLGEEIRDARTSIARTILLALVITVIVEIVPVIAVLVGSPSLPGLFDAGSGMMSYFVTARGGSTLNTVISLAIALAIINAVLAILLLTSRLLFSTARDTAWPGSANRALGRIHPRFHTPWVATLTVGALSAAVCFVPIDVLFVVTGSALIVVYAALCVAAIMGRRNGSTSNAGYRMWAFPLPPLLALAALGYVTYQTARDPVIGRPSLYVTAGILAVSAVCYFLRRRHWVLREPSD